MQGLASLPYSVEENTSLDVPTMGIFNNGRGRVKTMMDQMAEEYGRNGDTILGHLTEGEMVVPVKLLEENPAITTMLSKTFADYGVDMNRYIVGDELNMRNPTTGQPEFFLKKLGRSLKKGLKKLGRSLKKVFKKVKKFVKKIAPIVLPIIAPFALPALIPAFGALGTSALVGIGSVAGNMIAGRSFKDSLKAGALSALTAGVVKGVGSKMGGGTFSEGFTTSFTGNANTSLQAAQSARAANIPVEDVSIQAPASDQISGQLDSISNSVNPDLVYEPASYDPFEGLEGAIAGTGTDPTQLMIQGADPSVFTSQGYTNPYASISLDQAAASAPTTAFDPQAALLDTQSTMDSIRNIGQAPTGIDVGNLSSGGLDISTGGSLAQQAGLPGANIGTTQFDTSSFGTPIGPADLAAADKLGFNRAIDNPNIPNYLEKPLEYTNPFGADTPGMSPAEAAQELSKPIYSTLTQGERELAFKKLLAGKEASFMSKYGGAALAGTGALYAAGAFDQEEEVPPTVGEQAAEMMTAPSGMDLYAAAPGGTFAPDPVQFLGGTALGAYGLSPQAYYDRELLRQYRSFFPDTEMTTLGEGTPMIADTGYNPYNTQMAAAGGEISGPGTGTSDSIPAMLSDGEFVMTAQAVRGAGNGDRRAGAQKMYDMMNQFESMSR